MDYIERRLNEQLAAGPNEPDDEDMPLKREYVFILYQNIHYEGGHIKAAFESKDNALQAAKALARRDLMADQWVEEVNLDNCPGYATISPDYGWDVAYIVKRLRIQKESEHATKNPR